MTLDVLHVVTSDVRRGAQVFAWDLHQALADVGMRTDIGCLARSGADRTLPMQAFGASRFDPAGLMALRRAATGAAVVVAHGSSTLMAAGLGLIGTQVPFIYLSIGDPRVWAGSRTRRWRTGRLLRRAAGIVAISPGARDVFAAHYAIDPATITVIPNGRDAQRFAPSDDAERAAARRSLGLPETGHVIVVVGALSAEKRVDVAIDAVALLPEDVVLVVAGDGPQRSTLQAHAHASTAADRIVFLGAVEAPESVLAAADVLALSSDTEGVPGVLVEAGLAGIPAVVTDVGWVRDVVRPDVTGLVVPRGRPDLMAAALHEAIERRYELGTAALAHCRGQYDMVRVTDAWQQLIVTMARTSRA